MAQGAANGDADAAASRGVGRIEGDVATNRFTFGVDDTGLSSTQYVAFEHEDNRYLAQVTAIEREATTSTEGDLVATAEVVGRRDEKDRLTLPSTPPRPDTVVERADATLVRSVLNLDDDGAFLGRLRGLDLPVHLDVNELVQKHCSILAKTGAGKSYALGVMLEEMLKHDVPSVVVDPHGEHASLAAPNAGEGDVERMREFGVKPRGYGDQVVEFAVDTDAVPEARPFRLDERDLSARDIGELLADGLTSAQTGTLHQAIRELEDAGTYTLEDIVESVEQQSGSSKWPVLQALEDLQDLGILSTEPTPVEELVAEGQVAILNLKGLAPNVQQLVVARVADELFEARKVGLVDPHLFVLEEAHNFAPERHLSGASSGEVLRTIASEGRKFGMGLAVVSQRPAKVDKNVLSQCNTQIILKVTNANDLKAISKSVEGLPPGIEDEIQALPVGSALVSEPSFAVPLFSDIRPRESRHGGSSIEVVRDREPGQDPDPAPEPEPDPAGDEDGSDAAPRREPGPEPEPAETAPSPAEPDDPRLTEVERAEELVGTASLAGADAGTLEAVLVELEGLVEALDELAARPDADRARIAGLRSSLRAHHARIQQRLEARGET